MIVSKRTSVLLHGAAVLAIVLGLWAWDAHGADIWRDGIFSFCV